MAEVVKYKVHGVMEGPFQDEDEEWFMTCWVEGVESGELFEDDIPFIDFDRAYDFKKHFLSSIQPIEISFPMENLYDD